MAYRDFILKHVRLSEGYSEVVYHDTKGIPTIGIGHNLRAKPLAGEYLAYFSANGRMSRELIYKLFYEDLAGAERDAEKLFPNLRAYSENRQVGLVDLVYNMGYTKMLQFGPTIAHVRAEEWEQVAEHLEKTAWYKQVGKRGPRVVALIRFG